MIHWNHDRGCSGYGSSYHAFSTGPFVAHSSLHCCQVSRYQVGTIADANIRDRFLEYQNSQGSYTYRQRGTVPGTWYWYALSTTATSHRQRGAIAFHQSLRTWQHGTHTDDHTRPPCLPRLRKFLPAAPRFLNIGGPAAAAAVRASGTAPLPSSAAITFLTFSF